MKGRPFKVRSPGCHLHSLTHLEQRQGSQLHLPGTNIENTIVKNSIEIVEVVKVVVIVIVVAVLVEVVPVTVVVVLSNIQGRDFHS